MSSRVKNVMSFAVGFSLGGIVMFLLDPVRGHARQAVLRDKGLKYSHEAKKLTLAAANDLSHRAQGLYARARTRLFPGDVDDDILIERIHSRLGRVAYGGPPIDVSADDGVIYFSGAIEPDFVSKIQKELEKVPGVKDVQFLKRGA